MFQNIKGFKRSIFAAFMGVFTAALLASASGYAQSTPCDPDYYDSLEARAWLEAQREITQNQNLIYKPDSVLEYTCYVGHLNVLAQIVHSDRAFFSETDRWGTAAPGNMQTSLQNLVGAAMQTYGVNFPHTLLGGRSTTPHSLSGTSVTPGAYSCDVMQAIWTEAKCKNFIDRDHDGFFTLEEYANSADKRELPTICGGPGALWQTNIDTATENPPWTPDDVDTFFPTIYPTTGCGSGAGSNISTGLVVRQTLANVRFFNERICIRPGCRWVPSGGVGTAAAPITGGGCFPI